MVKHRRTRRHRQRGGWWNPFSSEPEDPNAPKTSMLGSVGSYFSSATEKANTGLGSIGSSISDSASSWTSSLNPWSSSTTTTTNTSASVPETSSSTYSSPQTTQTQIAGRRRRKSRRKMRGGKGGLGLTYYATDVSNIKMADPTYWIKGGSRRRRTRRHRKH